MSLWGGLLKLGYRLWRHRVGPLALGYWPLLLGAVGAIILRRIPTWPYVLALSALGLVLVVVMLLARWQGYIRFQQDDSLAAHLPPGVDPIEPDEKISVQATGVLEVRDKQVYFVAATANFATMETREHVCMARIPPSRMWLVAQSAKEEVGWWYAFVNPASIRGIQTGWLHHGLRPQPALKLVYQRHRFIEGKKKTKEIVNEETVYLSVSEMVILHRLLDNLVRDAGKPSDFEAYVPRDRSDFGKDMVN